MHRIIPAGRYKKHESLDSDLCWYCGRIAEVVDHFPPISREAEVPQIQGWLVNSCERCNSFLGSMLHISLRSRKLHVQEWLKEKIYVQMKLLQGHTALEVSELTGWSLGRISRARHEYAKEKAKNTWKYLEEKYVHANKWIAELTGDENANDG